MTTRSLCFCDWRGFEVVRQGEARAHHSEQRCRDSGARPERLCPPYESALSSPEQLLDIAQLQFHIGRPAVVALAGIRRVFHLAQQRVHLFGLEDGGRRAPSRGRPWWRRHASIVAPAAALHPIRPCARRDREQAGRIGLAEQRGRLAHRDRAGAEGFDREAERCQLLGAIEQLVRPWPRRVRRSRGSAGSAAARRSSPATPSAARRRCAHGRHADRPRSGRRGSARRYRSRGSACAPRRAGGRAGRRRAAPRSAHRRSARRRRRGLSRLGESGARSLRKRASVRRKAASSPVPMLGAAQRRAERGERSAVGIGGGAPALARKAVLERMHDQRADQAGVAEADLGLGGMHIGVDLLRIERHEQRHHRMAVARQIVGIGRAHRAEDQLVAHRAAVDEQRLPSALARVSEGAAAKPSTTTPSRSARISMALEEIAPTIAKPRQRPAAPGRAAAQVTGARSSPASVKATSGRPSPDAAPLRGSLRLRCGRS